MLWKCQVTERNIINCISVLLNSLKTAFYNRHLSHYFIRDINLFDNVADEIVLYGQAILE